jgi:hypothetical protein
MNEPAKELVEKGEMKGTDRSVHVLPQAAKQRFTDRDREVCPLHFAFFNKL